MTLLLLPCPPPLAPPYRAHIGTRSRTTLEHDISNAEEVKTLLGEAARTERWLGSLWKDATAEAHGVQLTNIKNITNAGNVLENIEMAGPVVNNTIAGPTSNRGNLTVRIKTSNSTSNLMTRGALAKAQRQSSRTRSWNRKNTTITGHRHLSQIRSGLEHKKPGKKFSVVETGPVRGPRFDRRVSEGTTPAL